MKPELSVIKGEGEPAPRRWCYHIIFEQQDENGFIPSRVTEGNPGHQPLTGGEGGRPWYWGKTYPEARKVCEAANMEMGITREDEMAIVHSSISVSPRMAEEEEEV